MTINYWLFKSEPSVFSITDLYNAPQQITQWDGVRNYQARNFLRDSVKLNDLVFFYHSNSEPSGIAGIASVVKTGYPDYTALDPHNHHYDPKSTKEKPIWYMVDLKFEKAFNQILSLAQLKTYPELQHMVLLKKGSRLSIQPVSKEEWVFINQI